MIEKFGFTIDYILNLSRTQTSLLLTNWEEEHEIQVKEAKDAVMWKGRNEEMEKYFEKVGGAQNADPKIVMGIRWGRCDANGMIESGASKKRQEFSNGTGHN